MIKKFVYNANLLEAAATQSVEPVKNHVFKYKTIGILLFLIVIIALSVFPLSRAIDQQVDTIAETTDLKHLTDQLVLLIVERTEAERTFFLTRSEISEQKFFMLSKEIMVVLRSLETICENKPKWYNWYQKVKLTMIKRSDYLNNLVSISRTFPKDTVPSLSPIIEDNISSGNIIKLLLSFVEQEEFRLKTNYERLNILRSTLNYVAIIVILLSLFLTYCINRRLRHNIAQLKAYQNRLAEENNLLETHVKERTIELENTTKHAQKERQRVEFLLQDASHRIGNSLATASSLLSIQMKQSKNDEVKSALIIARDHIQTLATAHRRLRLSEDMDTVDTKDFFETIIKDIALSLRQQKQENITIKNHIESHQISARDATTLAIIIGELIINAVKHAFIENSLGIIEVILHENQEGGLDLTVEDNGKGLPKDIDKATGLGILIISKLCGQFDVKPIFENKAEGGARTIIKLKNLKL